jgi:hypothetical protein
MIRHAFPAAVAVAFLGALPFTPLCRAQLSTNPTDLVGLWAAEGDASDTVSTNHGTIVGSVTFDAGQVGAAFQFDGTGGMVQIPSSPSLQLVQESTLMAWVQLDQLPSQTGQFMYMAGRSQAGNDFDLEVESDNRVRYYPCGGAGAGGYPGSATVLQTGIWYHIAATYKANQRMQLFVNGAKEVNVNLTCALAANPGPFTIGLSPVWGRPFHGRIDQVRLYSRELSDSDVLSVYQAEAQGLAIPLLHIRLSEVEFSWETQAGRAYSLQYSSDLSPGVWFPLSSNAFVGTGGLFRANDAITVGQPRRYYRLVLTNQAPSHP